MQGNQQAEHKVICGVLTNLRQGGYNVQIGKNWSEMIHIPLLPSKWHYLFECGIQVDRGVNKPIDMLAFIDQGI